MNTVGNRLDAHAGLIHYASMRNRTEIKTRSAARAIKALGVEGNAFGAGTRLRNAYGDDCDEALFIERAAIPGAQTTDADWGGSIADITAHELFQSAKELGVHGRLTQVPPNVKLTGIGTPADVSFVAEGGFAPLTSLSITGASLPSKQVTAILIASKELMELSIPRADKIFETELQNAIVNSIDGALLSTSAASSSTPAGLFNGLTPHTATSDATADLRELVDDFDGDLTQAFFTGSPKVLASLNSDARPLVGINGGELLGAPAVATRNAPAGTLALIDGSGVAFADGGIDIDLADEASLVAADNPAGSDPHVSLWQSGLVAIKITRKLNWATVRPGSVAYISGAAW